MITISPPKPWIHTIIKSELCVDTSGWVSIIGNDEPYHQATTNVYRAAVQQRRHMVTTNYIIAELVALLTNRRIVPRSRMIAFTASLKAAPHLTILHRDQATDDEAWALVKSHADKFWSLTDAASFVVMRRQGITEAISTDQHFTQAGFIRLPSPT